LWFDGRDLLRLSDREMTELRGAEIGMVFQDPMTSLKPVQRIIDHLTETIQAHEPETSTNRKRAINW
jgi:ABC-type microcin C transport system duplicated ATPase subunit YejF